MTAAARYCTFALDGLLFGVEVERVQEVIRAQAMTPVPLSSRVVRGLINLRGQIVTALDLRLRLELPGPDAGCEPLNVVIRSSDGPVSLLVDAIGDVVEGAGRELEPPPPTLRGAARELIRGALPLPGRLLLVLDLDKTLVLKGP